MPNKPTVVQTNSTPGSIRVVELKVLTFQELWDNYPVGDPYRDPHTGRVPPGYSNQCAIRMSVTFHRVGIAMKSYHRSDRILIDGKSTASRADELAEWLKLRPFAGLPAPEDITGNDWESKVKGRKGIIEFSRYWTRHGEDAASASGGHIDLWNGSRLTVSSATDAIATFSRVIGVQSLFPGTDFGWSDLRNSKRILFWEIK
ncbi:type VI secretion system amidase effector protein Tae4 [Paraburkholderia nemoris]|uniref:type VI secretion system amidase effector protein Tae4 n=1 Tax=Paraburkholderia nemoris TaxID=2793076 RepID=UPI0038BD8A58